MSNIDTKSAEVAEKILSTQKNKETIVELSTGVKLRVTPISPIATAELTRRHKRPTPPVVMIKDIGRSEENPNDPVYVKAVKDWEMDITMGVVNLIIVLGTGVVFVPDTVDALESEDWLDKLEVSGVDVGTSRASRYLAWVKYIAGPGENDIANITNAVTEMSGITEEEVRNQADAFRDEDTGVPSP